MNNPDKALFGVFDGHGGREVAVYCSMHYEKLLEDSYNEEFKSNE
jgi:serine/threonine protein phosphatase PrpC